MAEIGCEVDIFGMVVEHGSLIHADKHGAVVIPLKVAPLLPEAVETIVRREAVILDAIRAPGFDIKTLRAAMGQSAGDPLGASPAAGG